MYLIPNCNHLDASGKISHLNVANTDASVEVTQPDVAINNTFVNASDPMRDLTHLYRGHKPKGSISKHYIRGLFYLFESP